ncbi:division/cell wall cluster transcriptional repressor MraZ [Ampullimonas aquatilis]|uniref:division/cell wall cluster transcriptional repressor MraZ n=1 Tax=Ampullimonas aquatilis TaxID=1341549 RepID=UPI003C76813B
MFQGVSALTLDAKGRLSIPTKHREVLQIQAEGRVTMTRSPDGCLLLFSRPEWEVFRDKVMDLKGDAQWWKRIYLGSASDTEIDSGGRVLISPELRKAAGLERDVMLMGVGTRFEIWDEATYMAKEAAALAGGMPDSVKNLSF